MKNELERPFISICIASYNYARYLKRGFEAIRQQEFKDYEVIYIDDCSKDDSVEIIKSFIKENPNVMIRCFENDRNMGLLYTKTQLIYKAKGQYVMLCDADDWMGEDCLKKLAEAAKKDNADRVISEVYNIDECGQIIQIQDFAEKPSKWLWNIHHGCLYKRELIVQNRIQISGVPDDVYLTTKVNMYVSKTSWIKEPLYYWLVHQDSEGRKAEKNLDIIVNNFRQTIDFIDETIRVIKYSNDVDLLELLLIKVYYLDLFHVMRHCSLIKKLQGYKMIRIAMKKAHKNYLDNPYLFEKKEESPLRAYARKIIVFSAMLERKHLLCLGIIGYHIISKFIYFDQ